MINWTSLSGTADRTPRLGVYKDTGIKMVFFKINVDYFGNRKPFAVVMVGESAEDVARLVHKGQYLIVEGPLKNHFHQTYVNGIITHLPSIPKTIEHLHIYFTPAYIKNFTTPVKHPNNSVQSKFSRNSQKYLSQLSAKHP